MSVTLESEMRVRTFIPKYLVVSPQKNINNLIDVITKHDNKESSNVATFLDTSAYMNSSIFILKDIILPEWNGMQKAVHHGYERWTTHQMWKMFRKLKNDGKNGRVDSSVAQAYNEMKDNMIEHVESLVDLLSEKKVTLLPAVAEEVLRTYKMLKYTYRKNPKLDPAHRIVPRSDGSIFYRHKNKIKEINHESERTSTHAASRESQKLIYQYVKNITRVFCQGLNEMLRDSEDRTNALQKDINTYKTFYDILSRHVHQSYANMIHAKSKKFITATNSKDPDIMSQLIFYSTLHDKPVHFVTADNDFIGIVMDVFSNDDGHLTKDISPYMQGKKWDITIYMAAEHTKVDKDPKIEKIISYKYINNKPVIEIHKPICADIKSHRYSFVQK